MSIIDKINNKELWENFIETKIEYQNLTYKEIKEIREFIDKERYKYYYKLIKTNKFPTDFPHKIVINKISTNKKRVVYSYNKEENIIFKFIAFFLYEYDSIFSKNCYAFRKKYGVKDALNKFKKNTAYAKKYCFKADISNYFNSIDVDILINKLEFVKDKDEELYVLFKKVLKENRVYDKGKIIEENHGAMAGTPCSPFFANIYLTDVDQYYENNNISYFRYSDDVLIFADTKKDIKRITEKFLSQVTENKLEINKEKVAFIKPGEIFEFLGFSYNNGEIDISENSKRKIKGKIKRKADALRRWQRKKNLTSDKAVIGFIKAMNCKFFGKGNFEYNEDDFTWCRWFFPNITTDKSIKEIDSYMQQYIRYIITGRHYKGNYKITYNQIKKWGYINLVHEYYEWKENVTI